MDGSINASNYMDYIINRQNDIHKISMQQQKYQRRYDREHLDLVFDGQSSKDHGFLVCQTAEGLRSDPFVANRTINENVVENRNVPYFRSVSASPLEFDFNLLWINHRITEEGEQLVRRWLTKNTYSEFYFKEYAIRRYFGVVTSGTENYMGSMEGYTSVHIRCNSSYAYSPLITKYYNINDEGKYITIDNKGDEPMRPYIRLQKQGDGYISIVNMCDGGHDCVVDNIKDNESITIDNDNEMILSDMDGVYHADDSNDVWVECPVGRNRLFVKGKCKMKMWYRFVYD